MTITEFEKKILDELSTESAFRHMKFLVDEIGERIAGTEKIRKAAEYIRDEMKEYGLESAIDTFYIYHSYPKTAELKVIFPKTKVIETKPCCHIASTLPEGLEGDLIYVGVGSEESYEGNDIKGKIALADMTWAPPRPEKARIAEEKGAKALIIMNWGPKGNPVIQMGATKSVWGNPTPETFKKIPQIPVISITRAAGECLKNLCMEGKVKIWMRAEATREWVKSNQPIGIIKGKERPEEIILIGAHLEAWGKTAICNSSGNSLILELARVLAKHKDHLKRSIIFNFWDGHEIAEAAGSTWFVDTHWDVLNKNCIAYVNVDNPGIKGTSIPITTSVPEIDDFLKNTEEEIWGKEGERRNAYKGGDESFFGVGVPYISFYTGYSSDILKKLNYASLSPWLHSDADKIDKIDKRLFEKHLHLYTLYILRLCNSLIIPYDFVPVANKLLNDLKELEVILRNKRNLSDLIDKAKKFKKSTEELNVYKKKIKELYKEGGERQSKEVKESVDLLNRCLIKISRELSNIMRTEAGRYDHDPYGYSIAKKPIPILYTPVKRLAEIDKKCDEFKLWNTKFIREKNRVSDAIQNSIDYVELITELIDKKIKLT
jgi:hypothetical protein